MWTLGPRDLNEASWDVVDARPSSAARCWTWSRADVASPMWHAARTSAPRPSTLAAPGPHRPGLVVGLTSTEKAELAAADKRIAELEAELAIHCRASDLLGEVVPQKGA